MLKYRSLQEEWIDSLGAFSAAVICILATVDPSVCRAGFAADSTGYVTGRFLVVLVWL
jgi:hypothetical protein